MHREENRKNLLVDAATPRWRHTRSDLLSGINLKALAFLPCILPSVGGSVNQKFCFYVFFPVHTEKYFFFFRLKLFS